MPRLVMGWQSAGLDREALSELRQSPRNLDRLVAYVQKRGRFPDGGGPL